MHYPIIPCNGIWFWMTRLIWVRHLLCPFLKSIMSASVVLWFILEASASRNVSMFALMQIRSPECFFTSVSTNAAVSRECGSGIWFRHRRSGWERQPHGTYFVISLTLIMVSRPANIHSIHKTSRGVGLLWGFPNGAGYSCDCPGMAAPHIVVALAARNENGGGRKFRLRSWHQGLSILSLSKMISKSWQNSWVW